MRAVTRRVRRRPGFRIALAAMLGVAGSLLAGLLWTPPAFAAGPTLTLNPTHGPANGRISATYTDLPTGTRICPFGRASVRVFFDNRQLGQVRLDPLSCSTQFSLRPPRQDRGPGQHMVTAVIQNANGSQARASYVIDGAQMTPSRTPTTHPPTTPAMTPASTAPPPPLPTDDPDAPAVVAGPDSQRPVAAQAASWTPVVLVVGGLLALGGAGVLGAMIFKMRRGKVADYVDPYSDAW
jgi:hypothetical protein